MIKQIAGNPDAISSAYSLYDYVIAHDLGGEEALQNLRTLPAAVESAWPATWSQTTPASYSSWTVEHPDWFVQLGLPAVPRLHLNGPDLCFSPEIKSPHRGRLLERRDAQWCSSITIIVTQNPLHLPPRQRWYFHPLEHTPAQLKLPHPEVREAGHPDHPPRRPGSSRVIRLRCCHDPGQEALPAPLVSPAGSSGVPSRH